MNESDYLKLVELAWRRPLTADEKSSLQAYLLVHPDAQRDWEEETVLNQLLAGVPDAPVSSNFTARVLQAIDLEERREGRGQRSGNWLNRLRLWLPRFAVAGLVVALGGLGYQEYEIRSLRQKAKYLDTLVSSVGSFPNAKIWEDFDAISRLGSRSVPENEYQPIALAQDQMLWAALASSSP